ncbi:hypothetical protein [Flavobacterium sp. JP2137]|uniref:hypothetical protein n=1 Tax=Flavobacterium sp. JP2137 TaxID=3414510 RepID=UPI003D2FCA40
MSAESYDQDPPVLRNPTETTVSDADKAKVVAYATELSEITINANKKSEQSWVGRFFSNLFSAFNNGVNFTMDGGKSSPYKPPVGSRDSETVDMTILMVFAMDVFGPETFMPGAAPDGSNPFDTKSYKPMGTPVTSTSVVKESEMVSMQRIDYSSTKPDAFNNAVLHTPYARDTVVKKGDEDVVRRNNTNDSVKAMNIRNLRNSSRK